MKLQKFGVDFPLIPTIILTLLGLVLRLQAARGDLWLDEIWSLSLVAQIHSAGEVFWAIPHANNHYLNSLWMYWAGQDASPLTYRMPAVIMGAASVPAAGLAMRRSGIVACVMAMLLFAISDAMVEYGSQARGYSGLILFELMAIAFARDILEAEDQTTRNRAARKMGICLGLGFISQFLMGFAAVGLGVWIGQRILVECQYRWRYSVITLVRIFLPSVLFMLPTTICMGLGIEHFDLGNKLVQNSIIFWVCYSALLLNLLGISFLSLTICIFILSIVVFVLIKNYGKIHEYWLYLSFLGFLPVFIFATHMPNAGNMRYFLPSGVVFLLAIADIAGTLYARTEEKTFQAIVIIGLAVGLNAIDLLAFYHAGRGNYAALIDTMGQSGTIRYGTNQPKPASAVLNYYGKQHGIKIEAIDRDRWCTDADWFVFTELAEISPAAMATQVEQECKIQLRTIPFPAHTVSGAGWIIYHVTDRIQPDNTQ